MNTQMKISNRKTRFGHVALALSLSLGTVGGMMGFVALTEPAFAAQGGGGGGGGAGGGANGGGETSVMSVNRGPALPNNPPVARRASPVSHTANGCTTARNTPDLQNCHYTERGTPRIVNIHGFANCAVIGQLPGANGRGEFYCLRPM